MFTVEKIEENLVVLEDRESKKIRDVKKELIPNGIKEGTILDFVNNKYVINKEMTDKVTNDIKAKFNSLISK